MALLFWPLTVLFGLQYPFFRINHKIFYKFLVLDIRVM